MGEAFDAVAWQNLVGLPGAKIGYIDGPASEWPAAAWQTFTGEAVFHLSVLANPAGDGFDDEPGNAGPAQIITAVKDRLAAGKPSVLYINGSGWVAQRDEFVAAGLPLTDAKYYPHPALYLGAADWTGVAHLRVTWASVTPVFCQWQSGKRYDTDETAPGFLDSPPAPPPAPPPPPPPPAPAPPGGIPLTVPEVSETAPGPNEVNGWVACVQSILNGRHGQHLAVDGRFGPATTAAVKEFQTGVGIAADGVVGPVTLEHLLA